VIGVRPILGRTLVDADAEPGAARVAIIGYELWQRRFGGNPAVVVGSVFAALALVFAAGAGFVMMLAGGVWMIVQVIADQRGEPSEKRYRDVER